MDSPKITLETIIPPDTAVECPNMKRIVMAKTIRHGSISCIELSVGHDYKFCKLTTTMETLDNFGMYWCPFPECHIKSRKVWLLKDHLRKTHHGPFFCGQCGQLYSHLTSLDRHLRQSGHLRFSSQITEKCLYHTIAAIKQFSADICKVITNAPDYIIQFE